MSYASNTTRYVDNEVLSRSSEWLVPLLYEHLIISLRRAIIQIEDGDAEGRSASLDKADRIVGELLCTLDRERGGEIAESMASLYSYFAVELLNTRFSSAVGSLPRLIKVIEELHGAWVAAAEQIAPRSGGSPPERFNDRRCMNPLPAPPSRAEILHSYSRYVAIVAEQLEASQAGDRDRVMLLLDERRLIEDELATSHDDESVPEPTLDELLTLALAEVAEKLESARLDQDQWIQISSGALSSARSLSLRPAAAAGRYPEPGARGERLDLRF